MYSLKTRAANLVDGQRGCPDANSGLATGLTGTVLTAACSQNMPHDDFINLPGVDIGTLQQLTYYLCAPLGRCDTGQFPLKCTNSAAAGGHNHNFLHDGPRCIVVSD